MEQNIWMKYPKFLLQIFCETSFWTISRNNLKPRDINELDRWKWSQQLWIYQVNFWTWGLLSFGHIFFISMQFSGKFWLNNSLTYPSWGGTPLEILDRPCTVPWLGSNDLVERKRILVYLHSCTYTHPRTHACTNQSLTKFQVGTFSKWWCAISMFQKKSTIRSMEMI